MHILLVDNFVDHVEYASWVEALHHAIRDELQCSMEIVPYTNFTPDLIEKHANNVDAVVLSGTEAMLSKDTVQSDFSKEVEAIKLLNLPVLGICGGLQLIGLARDERVVYMGRLIDGYREVEVLVDDPLFQGLPKTVTVTQSHEEMVEHVPKGFTLLARSPDTPVEAVRNSENSLTYGVQFHPEVHDEHHPAGKLILANFAEIVKH